MRRGFARGRRGVDEVAEMEMALPQAPAEFAQDLATDAGRDDRIAATLPSIPFYSRRLRVMGFRVPATLY